ncbi:MAG: FAD-binding protein [Sphingomonadales bacterium]|nr:FAD-binding protein [Sphingomonadales bacterium]
MRSVPNSLSVVKVDAATAADPQHLSAHLIALSPFGAGVPVRITKRSLDARHGRASWNYTLEDGTLPADSFGEPIHKPVHQAQPVHILGAGPSGLFAAIECIALGYRPVILERGKVVRERRRDLVQITREGIVPPHSNYCFGEGGAGTFSDGKLYTRSIKRGELRPILDALVYFGAPRDILIDAHPHIGTNKLPDVLSRMRLFIESCGGEYHFNTWVTGIERDTRKIRMLKTNDGQRIPVDTLLLATGHSARDVFELLHRSGVALLAKPFALGVRMEHPQELINRTQYRRTDNHGLLPPAGYKLIEQSDGRGVFSFCMCPGGIIAPCATGNEEIVTNGWSPSRRNNPYANSGWVTEIRVSDYPDSAQNPLALMKAQAAVERAAWLAGGGLQKAPAQRLTDFLEQRVSASLPVCSYHPGVTPSNLYEVLPKWVSMRLADGLNQLGRSMPSFLTEEAILVAPESRTSSPVRIPRNPETRAHPQVDNLFPVGEGAGYAGGIMSASIDGRNSMQAIARYLSQSI